MDVVETIKNFEHCVSVNSCDDCHLPLPRFCTTFETKDFLELLKRQERKIEELSCNLVVARNLLLLKDDALEKIKNYIRAEAIKEFAERLRSTSGSSVAVRNGLEIYSTKSYTINAVKLDNLVREMVGDKE